MNSWRPKCSVKTLAYFMFSLTIFVFVHIWIANYAIDFASNVKIFFTREYPKNQPDVFSSFPYDNATKFILAWNGNHLLFKNGKSVFPKLKCPVKNCVFTENARFLCDYTQYDAILFNECDLTSEDKPKKRADVQKYIFTSLESSNNRPACELYNDNFFNWTLTYRLDSTIPWTYFVVRNLSGAIVAPSNDVIWNSNLDTIKPEIKEILGHKKKPLIWVVNHCVSNRNRDHYLSTLRGHLHFFSIKIDVYGNCSNNECDENDCQQMTLNDYYFSLAFEDVMSKDYVTGKVLLAYNNYAVPIVFGSANYIRFLPPGSYINARELHPYNLANTINDVVKDPRLLDDYFRWTNLYSIEGDREETYTHALCDLCAALHVEVPPTPAMKSFRQWWNGRDGMKLCLPQEYWNETVIRGDTRYT